MFKAKKTEAIEGLVRANRIFIAYSNQQIPEILMRDSLINDEGKVREFARLYGWIKAIDERALAHFYSNGAFFEKIKKRLIVIDEGDYAIKMANQVLSRGCRIVRNRIGKNRLRDLNEVFKNEKYEEKETEIIERWRETRYDSFPLVIDEFKDIIWAERARVQRVSKESDNLDIKILDFLYENLDRYGKTIQARKEKRFEQNVEKNRERKYGRINFSHSQIERFRSIRKRYLENFILRREDIEGDLRLKRGKTSEDLFDKYIEFHNKFGNVFYMVSNNLYLRVEATPFAEKYLNYPLAQIILAIHPASSGELTELLTAIADPSFEHTDGAIATVRMRVSDLCIIEELQSDIPDLVRFKGLKGSKKNKYGKLVYGWKKIALDVAEHYAREYLNRQYIFGATPYQMYQRYGTIMHPQKADVYYEELGLNSSMKAHGNQIYFSWSLNQGITITRGEFVVRELIVEIRNKLHENKGIDSTDIAQIIRKKLASEIIEECDVEGFVYLVNEDREIRKDLGKVLAGFVVACADRFDYFDFSSIKEISGFVIKSDRPINTSIRGNFSYVEISGPTNINLFGKVCGRGNLVLDVASASIHLEGKEIRLYVAKGKIDIYGERKKLIVKRDLRKEPSESVFENSPFLKVYGNVGVLDSELEVRSYGKIKKAEYRY